MEEARISSITAGSAPIKLTVRVIRIWPPFPRKPDLAYLLIDKHGDAIQATTHSSDTEYFKSKIALWSCYNINNYICYSAPTTLRIARHPATLKLGRTTTITQVPVPKDFPTYYFTLATYTDLIPRINKTDVYTDYAARLDQAINDKTTKGTEVLRLRMTDISGGAIEATLWPEVIPRFDQKAASQADKPTIIVPTSTRVSEFKGNVQLSSTTPTNIYLNPDEENVKSLAVRFREEDPPIPAANLLDTQPQQTPEAKSTIAAILDQRKTINTEKTFLCEGHITYFPKTRQWFYPTCPQCKRKVFPENNSWRCGNCEDTIAEPVYTYCVNADIGDETGSLPATLFNEAVVSLIHVQCKS